MQRNIRWMRGCVVAGAAAAGVAGFVHARGGGALSSASPAGEVAAGTGPAVAPLSPRSFRLPLVFERNDGQTDPRVRFLARSAGCVAFFEPDRITLAVRPTRAASDATPSIAAAVGIRVVGGDAAASVEGLDLLPGRSNYLIGDDPAAWRTDIPQYARVLCRDVLPGTDVVHHGRSGALEFDLVVRPGADPAAIRLALDGVRDVRVAEATGDLLLGTASGDIALAAPVVYQERAGERLPIDGRYRVLPGNEVAFEVAAYDRDLALVIDPVVSFSTYLGGSAGDAFDGVAVDASGFVYGTGMTVSANFPTVGGVQSVLLGTGDTVIVKLDPATSAVVYSTYVGGALEEGANRIAVDPAGNAYVTGRTDSTNHPVVNAAQPAFGGGGSFFRQGDAFVSVLNAAGNGFVYSTYLGGSGNENGLGICVDAAGNASVIGRSDSSNFPVFRATQPLNAGSWDLFVTRFTSAGAVQFSTYLGGSGSENATYGGAGIACDAAGNVFVTAGTASANFPTVSALQPVKAGGDDAIVAKIDTVAPALRWSTYLGGSSLDGTSGIGLDGAGNVIVTGCTASLNFPTVNPFQASNAGGFDAFVSKFDPTGATLVYSTYLGGAGGEPFDGGNGNSDLAVDPAGSAYVVFPTRSANAPLVAPLQSVRRGPRDGYVAQLTPQGGLAFATYLGGTAEDAARAVAFGGGGVVCVSGYTFSVDFATLNPVQSGNAGANDVFLTCLTFNRSPVADAGDDVTVECAGPSGTSVTLDGSGSNDPDGQSLVYAWTATPAVAFDDASSVTPAATFPHGTTVARLAVSDGAGGTGDDTVTVRVVDTVPPAVTITAAPTSIWPPNHKMVRVAASIEASDACGPVTLVSVTASSSEPDDASGGGDGNTSGDTDGADGYTAPVDVTSSFAWSAAAAQFVGVVQLRAERAGGGAGRTYTLRVTVADAHGNQTQSSCAVVVEHDRGR